MDHSMHHHHNEDKTDMAGSGSHEHHHGDMTNKNMDHGMHAQHNHMVNSTQEPNLATYSVVDTNSSMSDHDMHLHVHNHNMHEHNQSSGNHGDHIHHHDNTGHQHHAHAMAFHARDDDYILFQDWQLTPGKVTFFVCLAFVLVAASYQLLKMARAKLGRKCPNNNCKRYILNKRHFLQTGLYLVQFVVGYVLMLAVMTYNAWIMAAAVTGLGLGYFFFGWAEYEEIVRLRPLAMRGYGRTVNTDCGQSEQELLPLSRESTANDVTFHTSNVACSCDSGQTF